MNTKKYSYDFPRPGVSADSVVLSWQQDRLMALLIQRGNDPYGGKWALPGGFLDIDEDLSETPLRELLEETGLRARSAEQIGTFGKVDRDPRGRVITVAWLIMCRGKQSVAAADDAIDTNWFPIARLPSLAFDHRQIIKQALHHLKLRLWHQPFGRELLPRYFSIEELRCLYESISGQSLNKGKFASLMERSGWLTGSDRDDKYRFDGRAYNTAKRKGTCIPLPFDGD